MAYPMNESESESSPYNALARMFQQPTQLSSSTARTAYNPSKTDFNVWDSMLAGANRFSAMQDAEYAW